MEFRSKRRSVPAGFVEAVEAGFDYDHTNTVEENRERATDEGYFGVELIRDEDFERWRAEGERLLIDAAEHQWALGDWIVRGEEFKEIASITRDQSFKHGIYSGAAEITGLSVDTIKDYAYVARNVPEEIRVKTLAFGHHKLVAGLSEEEQRKQLELFKTGHLTVDDARRRIQYLRDKGQLSSKPAKAGADSRPARLAKEPQPKSELDHKPDKRAQRIVKLCDQLLDSLSEDYIAAAATPAAHWTLTLTAARVREVLEEAETASVHTDVRPKG
jgi:hypothetical protein